MGSTAFVYRVTEGAIVIGVEHLRSDGYSKSVRPAAQRLAARCAGYDACGFLMKERYVKGTVMSVVPITPYLTMLVWALSYDVAEETMARTKAQIADRLPTYRIG